MYIYQESTSDASDTSSVTAVSGSPPRSRKAYSDEDDKRIMSWAEDVADSDSDDSNPVSHLTSRTDYTSTTPSLSAGLKRLLNAVEQERLVHLDRLKLFLATAPSRWDSAESNANPTSSSSAEVSSTEAYSGLEPAYHHTPPHPALNRFLLPNQEFVTCVLWNGLYHITGTDIVRALVFRFEV